MKEKLLELLKEYENEIEQIKNDLSQDVLDGEREVENIEEAMLAGAEDQLQMVITDLKILLELK